MRDESKVHYSQVETHSQCPFKYACRYIWGLRPLGPPAVNNPLVVGSATHMIAEHDYETARQWYIDQFFIGSDEMYDELFKMKYWSDKIKEVLDELNIIGQEIIIETDDYQGTIDIVTGNDDGTVDLWDIKYSNMTESYRDKEQLPVYKYFYEEITGKKVKNLHYIFIPKCHLKRKDNEHTFEFRQRVFDDLETKHIRIVPTGYSELKMARFSKKVLRMQQDAEYPKKENEFCGLCEYKNYCKKGDDSDMNIVLPPNERRKVGEDGSIKGWLMGPTMSGKTWFLNESDNPIFLNTDGNVDEIDAPVIRIKDHVEKKGRMTNTTPAFEVFNAAVDKLLEGEHTFKTIIVDLLDDVHESSRLWVYDQLGIKHETDAGYGKGHDAVKMNFLPAIRKLMNSEYDVWLVSHVVYGKYTDEEGSDNETTKAVLSDKTANKIAGMCKVILHTKVDRGEYKIVVPKDDKRFGGSRLSFENSVMPSDYASFREEYDKAVVRIRKEMEQRDAKRGVKSVVQESVETTEEAKSAEQKTSSENTSRRSRRTKEESIETTTAEETVDSTSSDAPDQNEASDKSEQASTGRTGRRSRKSSELESTDEVESAEESAEETVEQPTRRRRRRV